MDQSPPPQKKTHTKTNKQTKKQNKKSNLIYAVWLIHSLESRDLPDSLYKAPGANTVVLCAETVPLQTSYFSCRYVAAQNIFVGRWSLSSFPVFGLRRTDTRSMYHKRPVYHLWKGILRCTSMQVWRRVLPLPWWHACWGGRFHQHGN